MTPTTELTAEPPAAAREGATIALSRARTCLRLDQPAAAAAAFGEAIAAAPDWAVPYVELAALLRRAGQLDQALTVCAAALARDADNPEALDCCARVLLAQRRDADAVIAASRAAELHPEAATAQALFARTLLRTDALASALTAARQALILDPSHTDAAAVLFLALARGHQTNAAIRWGHRAITLERAQKPVILELATQLQQRGDSAAAALLFEEARRRFPEDAVLAHQAAAGLGETTPRAPAGYVEAVFDRAAEQFDSHLVGTLSYRAHDLVVDALLRARRARRPRSQTTTTHQGIDILDAGCGTGLCAPRVRPRARTLVGVDLSAGMLARAARRGLYDALHQAELITFLQHCDDRFDAVISADVLCYFGDLEPLFAAAARVLRPAGIMSVTVEAQAGTGYGLTPSGRYTHSLDHLRHASTAWFRTQVLHEAILRTESTRPVRGFVGVFEIRAAAGPHRSCDPGLTGRSKAC
ncbi:MAG: methyltransferase domain-containing protein [Azospirillaceae bacterium]|nr:methyltransferase domain-containing protein [Azospirillaceae bacterium]